MAFESACSFCIYIRHISYTLYHHAVGSNKRAFTHPSKQAQKQGPQLPLRFLQHFIKYLSSVHGPLAFGDQPGNAYILARGPPRLGSIFLLKKSRRLKTQRASFKILRPCILSSTTISVHIRSLGHPWFHPSFSTRTNSELFWPSPHFPL